MKDYKNGSYLMTRDEIMKEQRSWSNDYYRKEWDFSEYKYWLVTEKLEEIEGFNSMEELIIKWHLLKI